MTDPPTTTAVIERQDPSQPLVDAVRDLYRACHLPVPTVMVAPSAPEFVRIVVALGRDWWLASSVPLVLVFSSAFALALGFAALRDILEEGLTWSNRISLLVTAFVSFTVVALTRYPTGRHRSASVLRRWSRSPLLDRPCWQEVLALLSVVARWPRRQQC